MKATTKEKTKTLTAKEVEDQLADLKQQLITSQTQTVMLQGAIQLSTQQLETLKNGAKNDS